MKYSIIGSDNGLSLVMHEKGYGVILLAMMTSSNVNISRVTVFLWGNTSVTGGFSSQRPVTRSFDVFFHAHLNKRLSKASRGWWFETLRRSLWRHCNAIQTYPIYRNTMSQQSYPPTHWHPKQWHPPCTLLPIIISHKQALVHSSRVRQ